MRVRDVLNLALLWLFISGLVPTARAEAPSARPIEAAMVEFQGGHGVVKGFLARPKGEGPFPAILMVHEWWGLSDWIKENARRFAAQGYVALAVDLYGGKVTKDPGEAHELMRALDDSEALGDLKGGVGYLRSLGYIAKDRKLGVIGWCMGGKFSRLLAEGSDAFGPTVICYGSVSPEPEQVARLQGKPVLGIFAGRDRGIPVAKVEEFGKRLKANGEATIRIYPDAEHGFMRPGGPQHNAEAAAAAWKEIDSFFAGTLKP